MKPTETDSRYWSYICYAPDDAKWADFLHTALETFVLPKILQGTPSRFGPLPKRLFPVFLDRDELPLASVEGDQIEAALRWSRTLIVICSPAAVASAEVDRQIRYFKSLGREALVFCVVVDAKAGVPQSEVPQEELLPKAARFQVDAEQKLTATPANPLIVDARRGKVGKLSARLKLVTAIIGCDFAVLKQRDVERVQRRIQMVLSAVLVLMMMFLALGVQLYVEKNKAQEARMEANRERDAALQAKRRAEIARDQALAAQKLEASRRKVAEQIKEQEALAKAEFIKAKEEAVAAQKLAEQKRREAEEAATRAKDSGKPPK